MTETNRRMKNDTSMTSQLYNILKSEKFQDVLDIFLLMCKQVC